VSTIVRPTLLPYTELYHWEGCASFVSDYLTMELLKSPITPVVRQTSSSKRRLNGKFLTKVFTLQMMICLTVAWSKFSVMII